MLKSGLKKSSNSIKLTKKIKKSGALPRYFLYRRFPVIPVKRGQAPEMTIQSYDTSIMENTMTNSATVSPTPKTIR